MTLGRVKWFNPDRGYGFIETETHGNVFVHRTCLENGCGAYDLKENETVFIEVNRSFNGPQAVRLRRINAPGR